MGDRERIEFILADWYDRRDRGEEVSPEDVIAAHPDLADQLRTHFDLLPLVGLAFGTESTALGAIPEQIGDFRVLREIGRGGVGVVYEAEQTSMGRRVALKVLSPWATGSREAVKRFRQEAQTAGSLQHTNIVAVHDTGEDRGILYYAMDLVDGPHWGEWRRQRSEEEEGAVEWGAAYFREVASMAAGVGEALHLAHQAGVIHRDVKPGNLLVAPDGTVKVVDFGLARLERGDSQLTVTGQVLGTPAYMSPEQAMARGVLIDHRTDVYSLGATLYEIVTDSPPFEGESVQEICSQIGTLDPVPPRKRNRSIPRDLETILLKAMEKEKTRRYATAADLAHDLRSFAKGLPPEARRPGPVSTSWRWVRRNRSRSAFAGTLVLLAIVAVAWVGTLVRDASQRTALREDAARLHAAGDLEGALAAWVALETLGDMDLDVEVGIASLLRRTGRSTEGEQRFGRTRERIATAGRVEDWVGLCRACRAAEAWDWHDAAAAEGMRRHPTANGLIRERAVGLLESGDAAQAEPWWRRLLDADPDDGHAHAGLGRTLMRRGEFDAAEQALRAALALDRGAVDTRLDLASLLTDDLGRHEEALTVLRGAPDDSEARRRTAEVLFRLGRGEEALDLPLAAVDRSVLRAHLHRMRGDLEAAFKTADGAVGLEPDAPDPRFQRALVFLDRDEFKEALTDLDVLLRLAPGRAYVHVARGRAYEGLTLFADAMREYARALVLDARLLRPRVARAMLLANVFRDEHAALTELDAVLTRCPSSVGCRTAKAQILRRLDRLSEARAAIDQALSLDAGFADAHAERGRILNLQGEYGGAAAAFLQALDLGASAPTLVPNAVFSLRAADRSTEARRLALERLDRPPEGALERAYLLAAAGESERARETLTIEGVPGDGARWLARARVLAMLDATDEAMDALTQAVDAGLRCPSAPVGPEFERLSTLEGYAALVRRLME